MNEVSTFLPRHAFSARDAARAGDVWRLFQEVAIDASTQQGWPPMRYRAERTAFVMRTMTVQHHLEAAYGEPLHAITWVARMRREMLSTREIRIRSARGPIASTRQEWVHVSEAIEPTRGSRALLDAFAEEPGPAGDLEVTMPIVARAIEPRPPHVFAFRAWWTWMDPLDHVNHPAYVDFCDEAIAIAMKKGGLAPLALTPLAEEITFRSGVVADEEARVESVARGWTEDGAAVINHKILVGDRLCATATTVRRLLGEHGPSSLAEIMR
jgi:acyl-CoA thioesterase FadM